MNKGILGLAWLGVVMLVAGGQGCTGTLVHYDPDDPEIGTHFFFRTQMLYVEGVVEAFGEKELARDFNSHIFLAREWDEMSAGLGIDKSKYAAHLIPCSEKFTVTNVVYSIPTGWTQSFAPKVKAFVVSSNRFPEALIMEHDYEGLPGHLEGRKRTFSDDDRGADCTL